MKQILIGATILAFSAFGAYAFHSGGVAECEGCHSMHSPVSSSFLLVATDASSTCLDCHENAADTGPSSYHISTAGTLATGLPLQRTPGGDFGWLKKTYTWSGGSSQGQSKGHNIIAADKGYVAQTGDRRLRGNLPVRNVPRPLRTPTQRVIVGHPQRGPGGFDCLLRLLGAPAPTPASAGDRPRPVRGRRPHERDRAPPSAV